jgi:DNA-binding IclR family transcriptional regulator
MDEHERELIQLIEGSPSELSLAELAREIGISTEEAEGIVERLERQSRLRRDGARLIVVESETRE